MEGFPSNLNDTFTSTSGCAGPMLSMCQLKVKVTVKCKINQNNLYTPKNFIECLVSQVTSVCIISPFKSFNFLSINMQSLLVNFILTIMAGYPSNLAKKFSPTEQFPQHILPLLPLYNAQWWGYESLTAIVLVVLVQVLINMLIHS